MKERIEIDEFTMKTINNNSNKLYIVDTDILHELLRDKRPIHTNIFLISTPIKSMFPYEELVTVTGNIAQLAKRYEEERVVIVFPYKGIGSYLKNSFTEMYNLINCLMKYYFDMEVI